MCDVDFAAGGVAAFFLAMGVYALMWPERVLQRFGTPTLTRDGRNEVRAVYGGFGVAVAAVLAFAVSGAPEAPGILIALGVALIGMAVGRLISVGIDGFPGFQPWLYLAVELVLGGVLIAAGTF